VAHVVEYLPNKFETLSSSPFTSKQKKKLKGYLLNVQENFLDEMEEN
jgi:hypothetical protein